MDLTVMFFGADDRAAATEIYDDVLAVATAADRLGLRAVWTPERHFQPVGQVFPNPALLSAALVAVTERIEVRAGSVVLPLYHPVRVVEDWAMLDNLSHGRTGMSVATGWHSADFVLAPGNFAERWRIALDGVATIRRLWSGGAVEFPDGTGRPVAVSPRPRPLSAAPRLWLTSSGSPATWQTAGRLRTNVLGATIGQTRAELAEKIEAYRRAYQDAPEQPGTPARGTVTVMAHTYVGESEDEALATVAGPLHDYFTAHVAQRAQNQAGDGRAAALSAAETDAAARFALRRALDWGSLIGSPDTCRESLRDLRDLGCDEIACFVDFGLDRKQILASLHRLADLQKDVTA